MRGCFVTGTDTGVGKTLISTALLYWLGAQGLACSGYKPVAAGTQVIDGERVNEDVRALRAAGSVTLDDVVVGPCQFEAACAPQVAATLEGRTIDRVALLRGAQAVAARAEWLVVEGVGGFCVPLAPDFDSADLAGDLALPIVLVVGLRLGCINHALLSAEAIRRRGLPLAAWVANVLDPQMPHRGDNLASLQHELDRRQERTPRLGLVPNFDSPTAAAVAAHLDNAALRTLFGLTWI